jgi:transposase InsO family protein
MDDEDKAHLAAVIAEELEDCIGIATEEDRELTARVLVARIETTLRMLGWRAPADYDRIREWASMTANLPEHHINRDVLTSHLIELSDILHGR